MVVYHSYLKTRFKREKVKLKTHPELITNKPYGGFWGCKDFSWKRFCTYDFTSRLSDFRFHVKWKLKPDAKILYIDTPNDFFEMARKYKMKHSILPSFQGIDFEKISEDYDGIEISEYANRRLHFGFDYYERTDLDDIKHILLMGLNSWDVPSICIFNPKKISVIRTTKLKRWRKKK